MTWAVESLKNFILMTSFWAKYILLELKMYRGVISHETEKGYKIWKGIDLSFQNWQKEFDKIWPENSKVSNTFIWMSSFWENYMLIEIKKWRGIIFHETEEGYKFCKRINLLFQNWHKEFDKVWPEHLKVSKVSF